MQRRSQKAKQQHRRSSSARALPSSFLDSYYDSLLLLSTPLPPTTLPDTFTGRRQPQIPVVVATKQQLWEFGHGRNEKRRKLLLEIGNDSRIRGTSGEGCLTRASPLGVHKGHITSPSTL